MRKEQAQDSPQDISRLERALAGLPADYLMAGLEEPSYDEAKALYEQVKYFLNPENPEEAFITKQSSMRLNGFRLRWLDSARYAYTGKRSLNYGGRVDRNTYDWMMQLLKELERLAQLYQRGDYQIDKLHRMARLIIRAGTKGMRLHVGPHPGVNWGHVENLLRNKGQWAWEGRGKILQREALKRKVGRVLFEIDRDETTDTKPGAWRKHFTVVEKVIRQYPKYDLLREELARAELEELKELDEPTQSDLLRQEWHELSLEVYRMLLELAPLNEQQPIGRRAGRRSKSKTRIQIADYGGGESLDAYDRNLVLGDLGPRIEPAGRGFIVERLEEGQGIRLKIGAVLVTENRETKKAILQERIEKLKRFQEDAEQLDLFSLPTAGLEQVEEFESVEAFLLEHGRRLQESGLEGAAEVLQGADRVIVLPDAGIDASVIVYTHPDWAQPVEEHLRSEFIVGAGYPVDGQVEPRSVVVQKVGWEITAPNPAVPIFQFHTLEELKSRLTPGLVYSAAILLEDRAMGLVIGVLTFQDAQGNTVHALFV